MRNVSKKAGSILPLLKKNWFSVFAIIVYLIFTASYIGPGFYNCTDSIFGFGDSTAGPIWKNSLKPDQPVLGGYVNSTNYPQGESIYSPVAYASLIQSVATTGLSKITNPVCAYNIYNIVGYVLTALIMFAFAFYLTRNRWIALIAGYAVSFTPYVQSKVGGHPNYGYAALLIAILWLLLHVITYRRKLHAALLGITLAACAYLDPYFILLAATVVLPVVGVWGIIGSIRNWQNTGIRLKIFWSALKPFAVTATVFAILVAPLLFIRVMNADLINSSVGKVRGNVKEAAMMCSNKPLDYLLPDPYNFYLTAAYGSEYTNKNIELRNWCGSGESRTSVSLIILITTLLGAGLIAWRIVKKKKVKLRSFLPYQPHLIIGSVVGVGILAFLFGLPPVLRGVTTPSGLVLEITEMWRIFAREYLLVNIALVTLFAIALKYLNQTKLIKKHKPLAVVLYLLMFIGIFMEYQINVPFNPPVFSYSRDVPQIYSELKMDNKVNAIAEYPIDRTGIEHDSIVYYLTMQAVHGKKIFNSAVATNYNSQTFFSLKDLQDPQTFKVLRTLGVTHIVVHGMPLEEVKQKLTGVEVLSHNKPKSYALTIVRSDVDNDIVLLKIPNGPKAYNILTIDKGYNLNLKLMHDPIGMEYEVSPQVDLKVIPIHSGELKQSKACFDLKLANSNEPTNVTIIINDKTSQVITVTDQYTQLSSEVRSGDKITVTNDKKQNMNINNLGCVE